eukprot:TRINITY_DN531_c0_g1_i2.p1 TRINITY_DN531_c0_g1~~TRINITY_DN531_c0_g1_i2.p1  ORF type:complete len:246 (-),score=82.91 TRINITY_DN531_c0_g1_i2:183-920(-)
MSWNSTVSKEVAAWFGGVVGEKYNWLTESHMQEDIKDGMKLCELLNKLKPGTVSKIAKGKMPFMCMERIASFIAGARSLGVPDHYNFMTVDLWDGNNMPQVLLCLSTIKRQFGGGIGTSGRDIKGEVNMTADCRDHQKESVSGGFRRNELPNRANPTPDVKRIGEAQRAGRVVQSKDLLTPKCAACDLFITTGGVNVDNPNPHVTGASFHSKCFNCKKCGDNLLNKKYYDHQKKQYCDRCILMVK